ncbi:MAG: diacylglycerol kinase [Desulfobulbaceae bacterium]|nr:diacylglycerol kinase [Desulfobulbaceae bacterium]
MDSKPTAKTGLARIRAAFFYSLHGLHFAIFNEAAFRQELCLVIIMTVGLLLLPLSLVWKALLLLATAMVLVIELLNSAIESVVDLAAPEYHVLAKHAKDLGSAAVLVGIVITLILWCAAIFEIIFSGRAG